MFTVEVKDEFGWNDYNTFVNLEDAIELAKNLKASFNDNVKVIDIDNMLEVSI